MDTIHEEVLTTETHESEEEGQPLSNEDKALLAKALGTIIVVGAAAAYGTAVAGYQAGRFITRKVLEYRDKKKEESTTK